METPTVCQETLSHSDDFRDPNDARQRYIFIKPFEHKHCLCPDVHPMQSDALPNADTIEIHLDKSLFP